MKNNRSNTQQFEMMTKMPIPKLVIKLGIPTTISMLVTSIYNIADTFFVSQLGTSASGAIGIVFGLMAIIQAFGFMFGQGAGSIVSRMLGAEEVEEASRFATVSFVISLITGLCITILGLLFIHPLMYLLGSTDTIYPFARGYGIFILLSSPLMMGSFVLNNLLRFEGKASFAMIGLTIGAVLNIFGDYFLIVHAGMGMSGAGLSTAVSQTISFFILWYMFLSKRTQSILSWKHFRAPFHAAKEICITGLPSLLRQSLGSISTMLLNGQAAVYGDAAVAAMAIVNRISFFVFAVGLGIAQGFQPVSGYNYGARKYGRVRQAFYFTVGIGEVLLGATAVAGLLFAPQWISFFRDDPKVLEIGTLALRLQLIMLFLYPTLLCTNMMLQSVGWNKQASMLSTLRSGLFFVPMIMIFPALFGIRGIQIAQPLADLLSFLCSLPILIWFLKDLKKKEVEIRDADG